jgi:hypothetical protein
MPAGRASRTYLLVVSVLTGLYAGAPLPVDVAADVLPLSDSRVRVDYPLAAYSQDGSVWLFWWQAVAIEYSQMLLDSSPSLNRSAPNSASSVGWSDQTEETALLRCAWWRRRPGAMPFLVFIRCKCTLLLTETAALCSCFSTPRGRRVLPGPSARRPGSSRLTQTGRSAKARWTSRWRSGRAPMPEGRLTASCIRALTRLKTFICSRRRGVTFTTQSCILAKEASRRRCTAVFHSSIAEPRFPATGSSLGAGRVGSCRYRPCRT